MDPTDFEREGKFICISHWKWIIPMWQYAIRSQKDIDISSWPVVRLIIATYRRENPRYEFKFSRITLFDHYNCDSYHTSATKTVVRSVFPKSTAKFVYAHAKCAIITNRTSSLPPNSVVSFLKPLHTSPLSDVSYVKTYDGKVENFQDAETKETRTSNNEK